MLDLSRGSRPTCPATCVSVGLAKARPPLVPGGWLTLVPCLVRSLSARHTSFKGRELGQCRPDQLLHARHAHDLERVEALLDRFRSIHVAWDDRTPEAEARRLG